mmetsp:Transcript_28465/g.78421  ORF Transcript_28465/g.78421 Transcript_28465/m.78421 type:complete len:204 (-) Transcript_28465:993-1604(-)
MARTRPARRRAGRIEIPGVREAEGVPARPASRSSTAASVVALPCGSCGLRGTGCSAPWAQASALWLRRAQGSRRVRPHGSLRISRILGGGPRSSIFCQKASRSRRSPWGVTSSPPSPCLEGFCVSTPLRVSPLRCWPCLAILCVWQHARTSCCASSARQTRSRRSLVATQIRPRWPTRCMELMLASASRLVHCLSQRPRSCDG